ncbi:sulfatase family protein [Saccharospirillum salsuginis]|uniref:Sulfatase n=1 Tax=Saccharospirillum salsuginis TaxID=418750 RepID=A0A918K525_9GAMM|nr:sulfatase-like hydrolase/transferase [Saccharospirillum salsuginis]GGX45191.1 sulfatase [Saccharospirillum salsuginis]
MPRPNYVIFMTDQQRADHLGCYGNDVLRTPNIDALAAGGLRFKRFYVANPICQPNRAALFTGQMPSVNGVRQNGIPLDLDSITFADVLRENGYRTGYIGKAHFQNVTAIPAPERRQQGEGQPLAEGVKHSLRRQRTGPGYDCEVRQRWAEDPHRETPLPYYGFDHVRLCIGHGDQVEGHYTAWLRDRHPNPESLRGPDNALPDDHPTVQSWRTAVPEELYPTRYVQEQACDFLQRQSDDAPFVLIVSFPDPHHPFTPPGRYWDLYDPADVQLPASFHHPVDGIKGLPPRALTPYIWGQANRDSHWPITVTEDETRRLIARNYGAIAMVDDAVGAVMDCLKAQGLDDNTVVAYTSDHGDYMGDHGSLLKLGLHFQSVTRVPFIWRDPTNAERAGQCCTRLASAIDLAPTILQHAGLRVPVGMQGQNFLDQSSPAASVLIEDPGIEVFADADADSGIFTLVTQSWRLSLFEDHGDGELYNLVEDPHELNNLWNDRGFANIRASLEHQLLRRLIELRDKRLVASARA